MTNSRDKGKRGEREIVKLLKAHGYEDAHRSQQFCGKGESAADVEGVEGLHVEVKLGYKYGKIYDFLEQAERDAGDNFPVVFCRMDGRKWLAVTDAERFIKLWQDTTTKS